MGTVVYCDNRVLLVRQVPSHELGGQWSIPWGRVEPGESPVAGAARETLEEAGIEVAIEGLLGVQELPRPWQGGTGLIYLCRPTGGVARADDVETDAVCYCSLAELDTLTEPVEPWCLWLVRRVLRAQHTLIVQQSSNPYAAPGFI